MIVKNAIPDRIAESLCRFPPFSMLQRQEVTALAKEANVRVLVAGDRLWAQGDKPGQDLFFLARGRVEYHFHDDKKSELVDVRDVGDVLGLTALIESKPFRVTALIVEDSVLYALPWLHMKPLLDHNDVARHYARRHLFWATRVGDSVAVLEPSVPVTGLGGRPKNILQAHLDGAQLVQARSPDRLLSCLPETTIKAAAKEMVERQVPSILIVDEERRPMGILTYSNIVRRVIVGGLSDEQPCSTVMSVPVVTVAPQSSATAALLLMLRQRIGQVVVTEDGTGNGKALDVCSEKDLLAQSGHHPAGLLREIRIAKTTARFRELCDDLEDISTSYLEAGISALFLGQICAELYDELVQRLLVIESQVLLTQGRKSPGIPWAWMSVGSDGRREQVLRTDMDNAIVFADCGSTEADGNARSYFLELAERVVARLVECGFSRCQGGVMACNPRWCKSETEWLTEINHVSADSTADDMLRAIVIFDLRFVAGNKQLCGRLRDAVFSHAGSDLSLQQRLASYVVETPPPLNFFGNLIVESKGDREGEFDIKSRGIAPLRDAARVLALKHGLKTHYSTGGRLDELRTCGPRYAELGKLASEAFEHLQQLRTLTGLRRKDTGRFIDPSALSKIERAKLANVFDVQRMVQNLLREEFQLSSN
jgi:CBS domain-containing protein